MKLLRNIWWQTFEVLCAVASKSVISRFHICTALTSCSSPNLRLRVSRSLSQWTFSHGSLEKILFFLQFANLTILRDEDGNWYKFRMHFFHEQFSVSCYFRMITIPVDIGPCYSTVQTPTTCPPNQYWCCTIKFSTLPNTIKS